MIVLDTSVVSLVFKGDPRKDFYLPHMIRQRTVVSFQTLRKCGTEHTGPDGVRVRETSLLSIWNNTMWSGRTRKQRLFPPICESNERGLGVG